MRKQNLPSAKTNGRCPASDILPIVVVLTNMQMTRVLSTIIVAVSDERGFEMIMQV